MRHPPSVPSEDSGCWRGRTLVTGSHSGLLKGEGSGKHAALQPTRSDNPLNTETTYWVPKQSGKRSAFSRSGTNLGDMVPCNSPALPASYLESVW